MNDLPHDLGVNLRGVITAFAQYGFRKTSMEDIARAAGLSRQSIYKKFGSKEACYEAVLQAYMGSLYARVFATLHGESGQPVEVLGQVFDLMVGEAADYSLTPHGGEVLNDALAAAARMPDNPVEDYHRRLGDFLMRHGLVASEAQGIDMAHVLITASRGAMINATSRQDGADDMRRVLATIFPGMA